MIRVNIAVKCRNKKGLFLLFTEAIVAPSSEACVSNQCFPLEKAFASDCLPLMKYTALGGRGQCEPAYFEYYLWVSWSRPVSRLLRIKHMPFLLREETKFGYQDL